MGNYEITLICEETEGSHRNCQTCNNEENYVLEVDLYNNILEVANDYPKAISIKKGEQL